MVRFATKVYHPNIDRDGRICLDTLKGPPSGAWKPSMNITTVLLSLQVLLSSPNPNDPLSDEVATQMRDNYPMFVKTAADYTMRYARFQRASAPSQTSLPFPVPHDSSGNALSIDDSQINKLEKSDEGLGPACSVDASSVGDHKEPNAAGLLQVKPQTGCSSEPCQEQAKSKESGLPSENLKVNYYGATNAHGSETALPFFCKAEMNDTPLVCPKSKTDTFKVTPLEASEFSHSVPEFRSITKSKVDRCSTSRAQSRAKAEVIDLTVDNCADENKLTGTTHDWASQSLQSFSSKHSDAALVSEHFSATDSIADAMEPPKKRKRPLLSLKRRA